MTAEGQTAMWFTVDSILDAVGLVTGVILSLSVVISAVILVRRWSIFLALQKEVETYKGLYESVKCQVEDLRTKMEEQEKRIIAAESRAIRAESIAESRLESVLAIQDQSVRLGICALARGCPTFKPLRADLHEETE